VALQRHLLDIGVDLALLPLAPAELGRRLAEGNFDVYLLEMAGGPGLGWPYWFWRSPEAGRAWVASGYAAADRALDAVRTAPTDDNVREAVADLQQAMRADPPALFLFWGETARAVRQRFEIPVESDRDLLSSLAQWRVRTGG
jgi:ABC-type transport system substrate-binding protein